MSLIQNPQLAQSYILLSVLRNQCNKLKSKIKDIPKLEHYVLDMEEKLSRWTNQALYVKQTRRNEIQALRQELMARRDFKDSVRHQAENKVRVLRSNINIIKTLKKQLLNQRNQTKTIEEALQTLSILPSPCLAQLQDILIQKHSLIQQQRVAHSRINSIIQQTHQKSTRASNRRFQVEKKVKILNDQVQGWKQKLTGLESSINGVRMEGMVSEEEIYGMKIKNDLLKQKINKLKQSASQSMQHNPTISKLQTFERDLQESLKSIQQVSSNLVTLTAEANSLERDNRLMEHKIECVNLLIKRLYACRDRLIVLKRNNNGASLKRDSRGQESMSYAKSRILIPDLVSEVREGMRETRRSLGSKLDLISLSRFSNFSVKMDSFTENNQSQVSKNQLVDRE